MSAVLTCHTSDSEISTNLSHEIIHFSCITLVNVYVDLVVFTRIVGLHRPEVVDIGVNTIWKNMSCA